MEIEAIAILFFTQHFVLNLVSATNHSGHAHVYDECRRNGVNIIGIEKGIIRSESYPSSYPPNRFCIWRVQAKPSQTIRITVLDVDLDDTEGVDHCVEYVSIYSPYSRVNHNTECGQINEPKVIDIDNNTVEIRFHSSEHQRLDKRGFQLEFAGCDDISSIENATLQRVGNVTKVHCNEGAPRVQDLFCIGTTWHPAPHPILCQGFPVHSDCQSEPVSIVDSEGYIHSPNFPHEYPPDRLCVWRLGDQDRRKLRITIQRLRLTPTDFATECRDYLGIYELTRGDPVTDIHCHSLDDNYSVVVKSGLVDILFESRERPEDKTPGEGFLIKYEAIGCAKLIPPGGATIQGSENETTITCLDGREFKLTCVDREWIPSPTEISCWPAVGESAIPTKPEETTQLTSTDNTGATSPVSLQTEGTLHHIPFAGEKKEKSGSFPLLPIIIGVIAVFVLLLLAVLLFLLCRRKKKHQRLVQEEDTVKISDPEDNELRADVHVNGNGKSLTSNGHVVTEVHYVRPTKHSSKKDKEKDTPKGKRTSYHLTVADDETAMIDNDANNGLDNT